MTSYLIIFLIEEELKNCSLLLLLYLGLKNFSKFKIFSSGNPIFGKQHVPYEHVLLVIMIKVASNTLF